MISIVTIHCIQIKVYFVLYIMYYGLLATYIAPLKIILMNTVHTETRWHKPVKHSLSYQLIFVMICTEIRIWQKTFDWLMGHHILATSMMAKDSPMTTLHCTKPHAVVFLKKFGHIICYILACKICSENYYSATRWIKWKQNLQLHHQLVTSCRVNNFVARQNTSMRSLGTRVSVVTRQ